MITDDRIPPATLEENTQWARLASQFSMSSRFAATINRGLVPSAEACQLPIALAACRLGPVGRVSRGITEGDLRLEEQGCLPSFRVKSRKVIARLRTGARGAYAVALVGRAKGPCDSCALYFPTSSRES